MSETLAAPLASELLNGAADHLIVTIPGDGVGPDVVAAARRVLDAAGSKFGFKLAWREILAGGCAIDAYGVAVREEDLLVADTADALLLGAVGGPKWDNPNGTVRPEQALFAFRTRYELFANLRPVTIYPELADASPLKAERLKGVDMLMVRELTGGLYFGKPSGEEVTPTGRRAIDTLPYHEDEIHRVAVIAFELARTRRKSVTSVDKANVLSTSRLWRKVVTEVGADYPDVKLEHRLVDSTAMLLATWPATFDVVVTENLFGDILTDEASMIAGSLGVLPSAALGEGRRGLYEPIHGSAPDIAGRGIANPCGTLLSVALLLRHSLGLEAEALRVEAAVRAAIAGGARTADIADVDDDGVPGNASLAEARGTPSVLSTRQMGDAVLQAFAALS